MTPPTLSAIADSITQIMFNLKMRTAKPIEVKKDGETLSIAIWDTKQSQV